MIVLSQVLKPSLLNIHSQQILFWRMLNMQSVFVYGTLKRGEPNHHWLTTEGNGKSVFIGEACTKCKYPMVIATRYNIPFLLYSPGNGYIVKGEIYDVDKTMLSKLDELEGHPEYYQRELDDIVFNDGISTRTIKCWLYFLKNFHAKLMKLPMLDNYSSSGAHGLPYQERSRRDPNYDHRIEVMKKL